MAREKHLTAVHIGNFKRFSDFNVENLGQFNLVVGDNNTGKTSFLEALVVDDNAGRWIGYLIALIGRRKSDKDIFNDPLNYFDENYKAYADHSIQIECSTQEYHTKYNIEKFNVENDIDKLIGLEREKALLGAYSKGFTVQVNNKVNIIGQNEQVMELLRGINNFIPFIFFGLGYNQNLEKFFAQNIDNNISIRKKFIERLKLFIPKIQDVRLGQDVINIFEEGRDHPKPLYTYGEGSTKFFRILCEIAMSEGKRLMIDEIDAGIHHTKFVQFWKAIMQAATEFDVQLFATTHNEECLEYFQTALELEELEEQRDLARVISLKLRKEQKVRAKVYDFASLQIAEDLGHEIRGGGL